MKFWIMRKVTIEEGDYYGHSYEVSEEVMQSLRDGWEPFSVTLEAGGIKSDYSYLWLKKQVNAQEARKWETSFGESQ